MPHVIFAGGGTGGHLYPAIALSEALTAERPEVQSWFVGARRGVEARVLPSKELDHTLLPIEPIHRSAVWRNVKHVPNTFRIFSSLSELFSKLDPALVVGTGGYASGPAGGWAVGKGIPLALQEQNSYPGFTTRFLSRWARQIHLGFPEAEAQLRTGGSTQVFSLGNPIRPPDATIDKAAARAEFGLRPDSTVVLVVGGSQGARAVNEALAAAVHAAAEGRLPAPPPSLEILWATGPTHIDAISERLSAAGSPAWVKAVGYIDRMPQALASADLAISRAGAMGTAELLAWGIPAILVPLPTAAANHQEHNAVALARAGAAIHLPESELAPQRLWEQVNALVADTDQRSSLANAARERARPDAARRIAQQLLTLVDGE